MREIKQAGKLYSSIGQCQTSDKIVNGKSCVCWAPPQGKEGSKRNVISICCLWLLTMLGNVLPKKGKFRKE